MKVLKCMVLMAALATVNTELSFRAHAGLFKISFGGIQADWEGVTLIDWNTVKGWAFAPDFPDGNAVWKLTDFWNPNQTNVTLTMLKNPADDAVAPLLGQQANNPTHEGLDEVYDGIAVPHVVKDNYLYRLPDTAGTEVLMRFANLSPGHYNVTMFEGRTSDSNGRFGKVWVDDVNGKKEPAQQNTDNYAGVNLDDGSAAPDGQPRTVPVDIKAGDYLWFAEMEDNSGGISGMIIRSSTDTDGDGMPDEWELLHGLNPNDPSDAAKDCNKDGVSNLDAYKAGLDPCDATPPAVVSASGTPSFDAMKITFSEALDLTGATNVANYTITPSLAVTAAVVAPYTKVNMVTLKTAQQTPGTTYTVAIKGIKDLSKNEIPAGTIATVNSFVMSKQGVLAFKYWGDATGGNSIPGATVDGLLSDPRYPASPSLLMPVYSFNSRDAFPTDGHEAYGDTMEGLLTPTESASYNFFIRADDAAQLWLSTDDTEAKLVLVAEEVTGWNSEVIFPFLEPDPNQGSNWHDNGSGLGQTTLTPIALTAGKSYFVRLIHKENAQFDYAKVAWRKSTDTTPANKLTPIPGTFLSSKIDVPVAPTTSGGPPSLTFSRAAKTLTIAWSPTGGTLQSSPTLGAAVTWTDAGAANPATVTIGAGNLYYRVKQ